MSSGTRRKLIDGGGDSGRNWNGGYGNRNFILFGQGSEELEFFLREQELESS
jgi:hypothetical protein